MSRLEQEKDAFVKSIELFKIALEKIRKFKDLANV
jgi:hypothetical protein